uniref:Amyloid beta precursor protein binding family B member 2 n=1 Tax=Pundamilia nyererei TaxID=303518 RepID=A0A3B4ETZ4_9CICH
HILFPSNLKLVLLRCPILSDVWVEGELPPGWREISDSSEVYFWHVPTGTTQYDRPVASSKHTVSSNDAENDPQQMFTIWDFRPLEMSTLHFLHYITTSRSISQSLCLFQSFPVRSLGWVEMAEQDLCEGRSSVAVHHCIRQLSYCRRDIRDSAGVWGEGKGMLLVLQDRMLTLVDPDDRSLLHSQPISSIRVWGVGRDHDR